ncbi:MAG TPA: sugar ABC transporter ATP-binding protein [Thermotogales bacterium]|nr:sugar ABC transporter ATP-binding protein [Thermotogales bacterium]
MEILRLEKITKSFPGVIALKDVDFSLNEGEIHALVGENGAGKSTLIKVIMGIHKPDSGQIYLRGKPIRINDPNHARELGISAIHQEIAVFPDLTVLENLFMGWEMVRRGFIDWKGMRKFAEEKMKEYMIELPLDSELGELSTAQQELVQILRALLQNARILIMDEPTAALTTEETEILFSDMENLKKNGVSMIYISHRLEEVFRISDRVTVLRDGKRIFTKNVSEITPAELVEGVIGRRIETFYPKKKVDVGDTILEVENLNFANVVRDVSFTLREGEILGIAGLLGSGRSTTAKLIFGILKPDSGMVKVDGKMLKLKDPISAVRSGIAYVPEDRHRQGLILPESIRFNISLPNLPIIPRRFLVDLSKERQIAEEMIRTLDIRTPSSEFLTMNLSGGNQQKVVLAKWLFRDSRILILDEPTQGIDVGAKNYMYNLMVELAKRGKGILFISSELHELLGMCDRILVMRKGRIVGEFKREEFDEEKIINLASGFEEVNSGGRV